MSRALDHQRSSLVLCSFPCHRADMTEPEAIRDTDEDLAFDVAVGLKKAGVKVGKDAGRQDTFHLLVRMGRVIVAQLKLARWTFKRLPPNPMHGPAYSAEETTQQSPNRRTRG